MQKARQALEKRFAVLLSDFLKMKAQGLGKCNLGQCCCNSESWIITLPRGVSFMSHCNVKTYFSVWVSQMNKMRTLNGKLTNQGGKYLKTVFVVNSFYTCHQGRLPQLQGMYISTHWHAYLEVKKQGVKPPWNWHLNYTLLNRKVTFGAYELGLAFFSIWTFIPKTGSLVIVSRWEISSQVADS